MQKSFFVLLAVISFLGAQAQSSLSGTISNAEDNTVMPYVEIYFPKLEKGGVTDLAGKFQINNLPSGEYKIIISYIGFETYSKTLQILDGPNQLSVILTPSAIEMEEVIVSTPFHQLQRENVMKVERADIANLKTKGAITLADGLSTIAGVSTVSTGVGIGKPVIRGLSSNRVLIYTQGVRLENQQFGDEHGLGVNDAGIESVEVIKGPASLLYGSDALGGVLYLNPEKFAVANETSGDVGLDYFSNTEGFRANAGFKSSGNKLKFLVRGSTTSHVDYKAGNGLRTTNSRFRENDLKTGIGYQATSFKTEVRYNYTESTLGIPETIGEQTKRRSPEMPYQKLNNHILSSKTKLFFEKSSLEATFGYIFNDRKEFEEHEHEDEHEGEDHLDEEGAALAMDLKTFNYNVQYHLPNWKNLETIVGVQGMHQTNENFGEEILIPNATTNDFGVLATSHLHFKNDSDLQFGLRYDLRSIVGEAHGIDGEDGYIADVSRDFNSFNVAAGYKLLLNKSIIGRLNLASGFRAPNLAELTSNGSHEGTNRYEIGNSELNNEQNVQTDLSFEYKGKHIELFANGFYNTINDYIFIEPNGEFIDGNAVFLYQQQDANLYGYELGFHLHPHPLDWLHIESSLESVTGKLSNNEYLPLIPANNLTNTLRVEFSDQSSSLQSYYAFVTLNSVFAQHKANTFETESDGYNLLNFGLGGSLFVGKQQIDLRISGNNILDKTYISHLSRLKTDGIANIGRNVNLGISIPL
ncbi:TonB-dependent receptor [Kriegella aquimaris]|uniref:Iron complex outermembrane recepter protein n=1 Tax=Kriegella aquimaris TaxID=192904 RepID=A0A1G9J2M7_9FLAO|nr:TonB-dependent receptor [Kriegella aquimaris]SDL31473.1 iron complex outermembrane recepter protein [Kriegella aquimaris]